MLLSGSHAHVRRFAHFLCSTPEDAEDAAQEALIVLYRRIGTLRATAALGIVDVPDRPQRVHPQIAACAPQADLQACHRRALGRRCRPGEPGESSGSSIRSQRLPAEQRAVLVLRDIQGLSGAATAQALGLSRAAMKSRLHRGRETVRSQLRSPAETSRPEAPSMSNSRPKRIRQRLARRSHQRVERSDSGFSAWRLP